MIAGQEETGNRLRSEFGSLAEGGMVQESQAHRFIAYLFQAHGLTKQARKHAGNRSQAARAQRSRFVPLGCPAHTAS